MRYADEPGTRHAGRYLLALILAVLVALGAAVPVFAAEEPAEDGGTVQPQVVGGQPVSGGEYTFIAALRDVTRGNSVYQQQFCGGTLIDSDSVLTAAHCVERPTTAAQLRVSVGLTSLKKPSQGQSRRVVGITRHPRFTNSNVSFRYDAAVLTLSRPVSNIAPATIPATTANGYETRGRKLTVAGWGSTVKQPSNNDPNHPARMQEAKVPVVSDARAERVYTNKYFPQEMLAAGREGKDTCQGDSGGPIFVKKPSGRVLQIGLTSFGNGCGARNFPGVYTEANSEDIRPFVYGAAAAN